MNKMISKMYLSGSRSLSKIDVKVDLKVEAEKVKKANEKSVRTWLEFHVLSYRNESLQVLVNLLNLCFALGITMIITNQHIDKRRNAVSKSITKLTKSQIRK